MNLVKNVSRRSATVLGECRKEDTRKRNSVGILLMDSENIMERINKRIPRGIAL